MRTNSFRTEDEFFRGDAYLGLYHSLVGGSRYDVRIATSADLVAWTFARTVVENADMPYLTRVQPDDGGDRGWLLLAHEQWMNPNSQLPSRLGFKLFYNESELLTGQHFNSFVAPLTVGAGSQLEGTPNLYSAKLKTGSQGLLMVDAEVGFHFNDADGVDQVAQGRLENFGPTVVAPAFTDTRRADAYDQLFIGKGAVGNIGQRAPGTLLGHRISLQEANVGHMPPT